MGVLAEVGWTSRAHAFDLQLSRAFAKTIQGNAELVQQQAVPLVPGRAGEAPMNIDLNRETEKLVNEEVQAGRFQNPQEFIDAAVKQFRIARELGESEAKKLATLRVELFRAEEQIERGECSTYDERTLKDLFEEAEGEGLKRLARERATK
jgi:Arc/MetJ-type ribon-helix-helix transcriptional regulator